jgi:hypothetical protein
MAMENGIIYRGPSLLDGSPIVVIATYSDRNRKTGTMVQTYIIRADMDPVTANRTGADEAICGTCPLRGIANLTKAKGQADKRPCYVTLIHGPSLVYRSMLRGVYPDATDPDAATAIGWGRMVRIGTYGDPAAVPMHVWDALTMRAKGWTAYTHQWLHHFDALTYAMASVESLTAAKYVWARNGRTFRIIRDVAEIDPAREVLCPASAEAGKRTTCADCRLCAGQATRSPKSVAIVAHGNGKAYA